MNYKDDIDVQIHDLKTIPSERLDARIHTAIDKSLAKAEQPDTWRIIMKSNLPKLASWATVLIIAAITVIHFSGGKINIATPVFADVIETIYKAKNVTYTQQIITSRSDFTSRKIATDTGLLRTEMPSHAILLFNDADGSQMTIYPEQKKCYITLVTGRKKNARPFSRLNWIQKMHHESAEYSHSELLDERKADVFIIEIPYEKTTIWVDPQTDLPVKIIMEHFPNKEANVVMPSYSLEKSDFGGPPEEGASFMIGSSRGSGLGISDESTVIMTDFEWDTELDSSLFTFEPSDDWEVIEKERERSEIDKNVLIKALSFWTEMSEGKFPDEIKDFMEHDLLNPLLIKKYDIGGDPDEQFDQAYKQVQTVLSGLYFTQEKMVNNNWRYAGSGVTFGNPETPIAWWQNDEDDAWTIIYADLSINETAEAPPLE